ncbi:family 16 glycosylhydrolase [Streptomyces lydicus]|uniref:family 16 glycosylhydrolase n=1 Tax=Streptomyces lydicus TaxID=47763 RepID=UPI0009A09E64|nr:family 16 glycosylhydrolase [Streptomyces lydicus]
MTTADPKDRTFSATQWRVLLHDDFTGPAGSPPDAGRWLTRTGRPFGAGVETHADDSAHVALDGAGRLTMTATRDAAGGFTAAWLESRREDLLPPSGGALRIQARVRTAPGPGLDCALWAWGNPMRHPEPGEAELDRWFRAGEMDVFEVLGSQPDRVHGSLHSPACDQLPSCGIGGHGATVDGAPLSDGFHTYSMVWTRDPDTVTWHIDARPYLKLTPEDTTPEGWLFNQPAHLCLAIIIGSPGGPVPPGTPDPAAFPAGMLIDEITVAVRGPKDATDAAGEAAR